MSYTVTLFCGCDVYVSCHPRTGLAHTRIVERRGPRCTVRKHEIGSRVWLWEMLPDVRQPEEIRLEPFADIRSMPRL